MFRILSRQAVKAVPRPFRPSTGTSRRTHSAQLPYTGPPSYETITRRFSPSQVDPQGFFTGKHNEEARDRGEYIEIHDVSGIGPTDYDVLISDIKHETLNTRITGGVGLPYLSKATEADAKRWFARVKLISAVLDIGR